MQEEKGISCLFIDIGGVLLTDGWSHQSRKLAAAKFSLDWEDMEIRHQTNFSTLEEGKYTMDEYLKRVVFYKQRDFNLADFKAFMFAQSTPFPEMIEMMARLKTEYGLKIGVVSNEVRELNDYRIQTFRLYKFVDFFISSCFVHLRKPDTDIFKLALDVAQVPIQQIIYIENTALFVELAEGLGIKGIVHTDHQSTKNALTAFGLDDSKN